MKTTKLSRLLLVFIIMTLVLSLVSCKNGKGDESDTPAQSYVERTEYTVTFASNGGTSVPPITVYKNAELTPFDAPKRDGYVFVGWTHEGREWVFGNGGDNVKSDMTLYANWVKLNSIFKYEVENGEITLTKLLNDEDYQNLTIPETFEGMPVTGIGDEMFKKFAIIEDDALYKGLKSITFPKSVTRVGYSAFEDCTNLDINFEGALTEIGENAFYGCNTLKSVTLGDTLEKIPFRAFSNCRLESIIIPDSVKVIDENSFELSVNIQTAVIPIGVRIEDSAFRDCVMLRSIFFRGNAAEFAEVTVNGNNDAFKAAKVYYYSASEDVESGKFWNYNSKGTPIIIE